MKTSTSPKQAEKVETGSFISTIGRRKGAIARVRLFPAEKKGEIRLNGKTLVEYFGQDKLCRIAFSPVNVTGTESFRFEIRVMGGGLQGQAEAIRLGIARALVQHQSELRSQLKARGFLTRDARVKERRKYGLKKARRAPQWAKR